LRISIKAIHWKRQRIETVHKTIEAKKFIFHSDPGHGWLAVKISDLTAVGIDIRDISEYSYMKGKTVYLEEDCDASLFIEKYINRYEKKPEYRESYRDRSPIRSYGMIKIAA